MLTDGCLGSAERQFLVTSITDSSVPFPERWRALERDLTRLKQPGWKRAGCQSKEPLDCRGHTWQPLLSSLSEENKKKDERAKLFATNENSSLSLPSTHCLLSSVNTKSIQPSHSTSLHTCRRQRSCLESKKEIDERKKRR